MAVNPVTPKSSKWFLKAPRGPWSKTPEDQWNDWIWQQQNKIKDISALKKVIDLTDEETTAIERGKEKFDMGITPYYAALMEHGDPHCPVRRQSVPGPGELEDYGFSMEDPLAEERDMPVQGITHRYPDRALFYATPNCAMFCRHCTRKRKVADPDTAVNEDQVQKCIDYVKRTPAVRDVIVSGGDPLTMSDGKLERLLARLYEIPHVEILRLGTRVPVTMPQRITPKLVEMLRRFQPIYVNTHFNHPKECTRESFEACAMLADAGFPIGNQMVLLKGVNDDPETVKHLNRLLLMMRVKPYYIYMCDLAEGTGHFRTTLAKGLEIMKALRGWTSGLAVPHFVIDAPGGGGKVPVLPDYVVSHDGNRIVLRNYSGDEYVYHEPEG